jgi:Protein of unknown function (DUF3303)
VDRAERLDQTKSLLQKWILQWADLGMIFKIVPVATSAETQAVVAPLLDRA